MGGLMSSAVLTLVALPYVNLRVEGIAEWTKRLWRESSSSRRRRVEPAGAVEVRRFGCGVRARLPACCVSFVRTHLLFVLPPAWLGVGQAAGESRCTRKKRG